MYMCVSVITDRSKLSMNVGIKKGCIGIVTILNRSIHRKCGLAPNSVSNGWPDKGFLNVYQKWLGLESRKIGKKKNSPHLDTDSDAKPHIVSKACQGSL